MGKNPTASGGPGDGQKNPERVNDGRAPGRLPADFFVLLAYFGLSLLIAWKVPFVVSAVLVAFYLSIVLSVPYEITKKLTKSVWIARLAYASVLALLAYSIASFFPITVGQLQNLYQTVRNVEVAQLPDWAEKLIDDLRKNLSDLAVGALNWLLRLLPNFVTMLILTIVTLLGLEEIKKYVAGQVEYLFFDDAELGLRFATSLYNDLRKFVQTQVLVSSISTTITAVGLMVLKIPYVPTFAVLMFFAAFFPFVGLLFTAVPMYLVAFTIHGVRGLVWLTVLLVAVNQLESWTYGPRLQSRTVKVHWFVLLISIFVFGSLLGFVGILLALPAILFIKNLWTHYVIPNLPHARQALD